MVSQIQFGNIFKSGGRQVLGGSNTGYDTEALVNGLADAKRLPAVKLEDRLERNASRQKAYSELQSILGRFRDASNFLRNPPGVGNQGENIFEYRSGSLSSNTSVDAANYMQVTVEPGASLSNYTLTVDQLATYDIQTTNTFALLSVSTSAVGGAGPFVAGNWIFGPNNNTVTLTAGDTLQEVANKFNAISDTSGVEATIIMVSPGNYRMQFKTTSTGADMDHTLPPGMYTTGLAIDQDAEDALMTIDGTQISRGTNNISDVIEGVTFNLRSETPPATKLTLDIQPDTEVVKSGILNFVDSYNELRLFVSRQTEIGTNGRPVEGAVLSNSATLRSTMSAIATEISRVVEGLTAEPNRLSDLGITLSDFPGDEETPFTRNTLVVDEDVLDAALAANFEQVRKIFEFDFTSSDSEIQVFRRTNALDVTDFTLNIDTGTNLYQATYNNGSGPVTVNLNGRAIPGGGYLLEGALGSVFDGLQLIYSGDSTATSTIRLSQGIGDRIYNALDEALDKNRGGVKVELDSLEKSNTRLEAEIDRIDEIVERYRQQLLQKFADLEKAIGGINTILASLDAQANALANR
jgi:flagellar hook-associated protein 2